MTDALERAVPGSRPHAPHAPSPLASGEPSNGARHSAALHTGTGTYGDETDDEDDYVPLSADAGKVKGA